MTLTLGSHSATTTADALGRVSAVLQVPAAAGEAVLSASDGTTVAPPRSLCVSPAAQDTSAPRTSRCR